jgi:hypothetical protein
MNQIFVIRNGQLTDGRPTMNGELPVLPGLPVTFYITDEVELFVFPPEWDVRGYFIEFYCARRGTDVGLEEWLAKGRL